MERRFRLQAVLRYRANREELLQLDLARAQAEEAQARSLLDQFRQERQRSLLDTARLLTGGRVDVAAVQQGFAYLGAVQAAIGHQGSVVEKAAERTEARRQDVIQAMQERKVLEKLKQRHDRAYDEWATRAEQALVDDMVPVRYNRRAAAGEEAIL